MFEQYEHHGTAVWVQSALKGKHREHCLCHAPCQHFKPNTRWNCPMAQENYMMCVRNNMVLPVWECPDFLPINEC